MIDGIKVQLTTGQLRDHLMKRVRYHEEKRDLYAGQVQALEAGGERQDNASLDPVRALKDRASQHSSKAELFRILADHLIPDETYRIADHDLTRIEFISQHL